MASPVFEHVGRVFTSAIPFVSSNSTVSESLPTLSLRSFYQGGIISWASLYTFLAIWAGYCITGAIYRLYFDPLAPIPGPKLAAMTTWYEGYYDIWLGGQYYKKIGELHEKYGPVVRINPHEIHCNDPEFIDSIYAGSSRKTDKYRFTGRKTLTKQSMVATISHDMHRKRRGAMANFFSKQNVKAVEPKIRRSLKKLLSRMEQASKTGEIMPMMYVMKAATSDIITDYAFGKSTNFMDREDYNMSFFQGIELTFLVSPALMHFPWLGPLMEALPLPLVRKLMPGVGDMYKLREGWMQQIDDIKNSDDPDAGKGTIFDGVLKSKLPEEEKATARLGHEAQLTVLAGQDTTATTLSSAVYELLANPECLKKLREELIRTFPDPDEEIEFSKVENLPYLHGVIHECLRAHPGVITRMPRVSPEVDVIYDRKGLRYRFPAGTPMSMTSAHIHFQPEFFPDPMAFRPERWIENPRLDKYLIAFSRGTRNCLGINLAYQELYTLLAGVFRKYDVYDGTGKQTVPTLELYDTIRERDVDMNADYIVPFPAKGSKSVQVRVHHPEQVAT